MDIEKPNPIPETEKTIEEKSSVFIEQVLNPEIRTQLQEDLKGLSDEQSKENMDSLKTIWKEKLPGLENLIEAVFTLPTLFTNESKLKALNNGESEYANLAPKEKHELDRELKRGQALLLGVLSEYLIHHREDADELKIFWKIYDGYSSGMKVYELFEGFREGIIGQVTTYYLIKRMGLGCTLARPEEDAFQGTDYFISNSGRAPDVGKFQVKHGRGFSELRIIDVKTYDPTFAVATELTLADGKHLAHFIPEESFKNLKNSCSPDELAYYLEIPNQNPDGSSAIDHITGTPSETLVKDFKTESERVFRGKFAVS